MAGLLLTRLCALPCGHSTLPSELSDWLSVLTALSFDIGSFIFPDWKCIGGLTTRLACNGLWPLVLMLAVALALAALLGTWLTFAAVTFNDHSVS